MNIPAIHLVAALAVCIAGWAAPAAKADQSQQRNSASNANGSNGNQPKSKKSKKDTDSNCPPDWMRDTKGTGTQIGTGQPDGVLPIGCHENSFDRGPPIGFRRRKHQKRGTSD